MKTIIALYRGPTVASAELIAVSADPAVVAFVADQLLARGAPSEDPVIETLESGRRAALESILRESATGSGSAPRYSVHRSRRRQPGEGRRGEE